MQQYQGKDFSFSYPDNWRAAAAQDSSGVTIAPPAGVQQTEGGLSVGYGVIQGYYQPKTANASLSQATEEFIAQLRSADPKMQAGKQAPRTSTIGGRNAIVTQLYSASIFQGQTEVDLLVTVAHPSGILFVVFVSPESEAQYANAAFEQMAQSLRFSF
jgi:hypothetical protein